MVNSKMLQEFNKHMDHEPKIFITYFLQPITEKKHCWGAPRIVATWGMEELFDQVYTSRDYYNVREGITEEPRYIHR